MVIDAREILDASILIVDDQEPNVSLLTALLGDAGYTQRGVDDESARGLRAASQAPLRPHSARPADAGPRRLSRDGGPQDEHRRTATFRSSCSRRSPDTRCARLQAGAKDFISKPFDLVEVKTRIRNMLEVRLLYRRLEDFNAVLEKTVAERTAELRESEARYRSLTELRLRLVLGAGRDRQLHRVSGPVLEMLGIRVPTLEGETNDVGVTGWNEAERALLRAKIAARQPFLDFIFNRENADGSRQKFRVSGEPMFNQACRFIGYRGIGVELFA